MPEISPQASAASQANLTPQSSFNPPTPIVIFGADGMLGSALNRQLQDKGLSVYAFSRTDGDVTDMAYTGKIFSEIKPKLVFNCVAYNAVDLAEQNEQGRDAVMLLNAKLPGQLAELCREYQATLVHYSSGYVFDGENTVGYAEDDQANPQSVYAKSKWLGEQAVRDGLKNYYVIRLNWLFGKTGVGILAKESFPDMILNLAASAESQVNGLKLINDEFSTPTYAEDLAQSSIRLCSEAYAFGTYHLSNDGRASWYDYGAEALRLRGIKVPLNAISAESMPRAAKRPRNSVLLNNKFPKMRSWQEALAAYYKQS
jgi:dTDP-4-dehydrorhamnose reductase